jgi:hypothetical protein
VTPVLGPEHTEHVRQVAERVLAAPEFRGSEIDPGVFDRLSRYLQSLLDGAIRRIGAMPTWLTWLVVAWISLTLLGIVAHSLYTLFVLGGGTAGRTDRRAALEGELFGIRDLDFDRIVAEALDAKRRADWSRAVRYGYAAQILFFDRKGWVAFETSKTNRDYHDELVAHDHEAAEFRRSTSVFEEIAYGGRAATEGAALRILNTLENSLDEPVQSH